ncbi:MAG: hypothetical protein HYU52_01685 [Acidobacteria bacterium]|nr:hypothetical protein [Acidobacteriota bacterium]
MNVQRTIWAVLCAAVPVIAQAQNDGIVASVNLELKGNYRDSPSERFRLAFVPPPEFLPPGEENLFLETVDAGSHFEASNVSLRLDLTYGKSFAARAEIDAIDLYERNPTSGDRDVDLDEAWVRFGQRPSLLATPDGSTLFAQFGKAPKMERQPVRLLESYGLSSTAFNRLEDVQALVGGTIGRNLYWRAQWSTGNPVFMRDTHALAGDHGIEELLQPFPDPELKTGFPILYDAEVEGYFFDDSNPEIGGGLGWRWRSDVRGAGIDLLAFYYERDLAEEVDLEGTFYGGDLDILSGPIGIEIAVDGNRKEEYGVAFYSELGAFTLLGQAVEQEIAGLGRRGIELEAGWQSSTAWGPIPFVQPAVRYSSLDADFRGPVNFPSPSFWWDWTKYDAGVRFGLTSHADVTAEYSRLTTDQPGVPDLDEMLVTVRIKLGAEWRPTGM